MPGLRNHPLRKSVFQLVVWPIEQCYVKPRVPSTAPAHYHRTAPPESVNMKLLHTSQTHVRLMPCLYDYTISAAHVFQHRQVPIEKFCPRSPVILQPYLLRLLFFECCSISVFCNHLLLLRRQPAFGFIWFR
jgi:hypothetical protein